MDIRIKTLTIENFKGVRRLTLKFGGANILIEGDNGTGKSTIFDAFTWLMFGKDHNGNDQTHFDIKTIDAKSLKPIERVDHSVEAELLIDGCSRKLKRIWRENWVKPKGKTEQVLKGHTSIFMVDDVDVVTKKNYDDVISQWADESVFRLITDPLFFIGDNTPWKVRREVLMGLVAGKVDRAELNHQFRDLLHEMKGDNMDTFRKRIGAAKKENKKMLEETEAKIQAWEESLPEEIDMDEVREREESLKERKEQEIAVKRTEIEEIDKKIVDINERNKAESERVSGLYRRITDLQIAEEKFIAEKVKDVQDRNLERDMKLNKARRDVQTAEDWRYALKRDVERLTERLHALQNDRNELSASLRKLGKEYDEEKVKAFTYEPTRKCHACGQDLPAETIEEAFRAAREAFIEDQKKNLNAIIEKAQKVKDDIAVLDRNIASASDEIEKKQSEMSEAIQRVQDCNMAYDEAGKMEYMDINAEKERAKSEEGYKVLEAEITELRSEAMSSGKKDDTDTESFNVAKRAVYREIEAIEEYYKEEEKVIIGLKARDELRRNTMKLIEDANRRVKEYADEIARCENLEYEALAYIKADISCQEEVLNSLFHVARWKMFDYTIDGGILETCEVTTKAGASFTSMNDAAKIQCGMDVIRVLSNHNRTWATIFIDNAESITQKEFDTTAQVVRLKVKEGSELTVSAE